MMISNIAIKLIGITASLHSKGASVAAVLDLVYDPPYNYSKWITVRTYTESSITFLRSQFICDH